ncbi:MAG TPA: response regulator [Bryobacteraceae bacterium]|nr:response regulator [Bryobacteraceae bacterium]
MSSEPPRHAFRLLLVEDNAADVYLIQRVLKRAGVECEMTVVSDGEAAIEYFRDAGNRATPPDLMLLDLNLPRKDGAEVLEAIRADSGLAGIRVAVMTTSSSPQERDRIEHLGVEQYITKGADLDDFGKIGIMIKEIIQRAPKR